MLPCARKDSLISEESDHHTPTRWSSNGDNYVNTERASTPLRSKIDSPGKRKTLCTKTLAVDTSDPVRFERAAYPDLSVDAKRRKLGQHDDMELIGETAAATELPDEVDDDFIHAYLPHITAKNWHKQLENDRAVHAPRCNAGRLADFTFRHTALSGNKHNPFALGGRRRYSLPSPPGSGSSPVDEITLPVSASSTTSASTGIFSQEQIQHNYHEFENRQKRKAAEKASYTATIPGFDGVVSPTDVSDKSIERIFLEHGEADDEADD
jgi:hypothetical protein